MVVRIYAYVDETGQDTRGRIFLVAVVVVGKTRDELRKLLGEFERASGKGNKRWAKSTRQRRIDYITSIINSKHFTNCSYFSYYTSQHSGEVHSYVDLTILTTAKAVLAAVDERPYEADVFVDGLHSKTDRKRFTGGLRKLHIKLSQQVRGLRSKSDELIRLADAMAGFARDGIGEKDKKPDKEFTALYQKALKNGTIKEI